MATVTCTTTTIGGASQTRYTCSGVGCGNKIKKLKAQDVANPNSPANLPIADFKVLQIEPGTDDSVLIGLRRYSVHDYDIIVVELSDEVVDVIVFKGNDVVFRNKRPKRTVKYSVGHCHQVPILEAFDEEEDFVRLDVRDLEDRYFKK